VQSDVTGNRFVLKLPFTAVKSPPSAKSEEAVFKKITLSLIWAIAMVHSGPDAANAQFAAAATSQPPLQTQASISPDDPRLILMIRNAIIALNQANQTGNYSVLRDLGTPNFQISNSAARLGEVFATMRARKVDISPIMFFNPKLMSRPSLQDGQVLRLTGFFPTTPEQVNFDLAFQLFGDQWMLAAIAVTVAPPGENFQASAAPAQLGHAPEAAESKPIRIDLSQPNAPAPTPPKKAAGKKPKPPAAQQAATAQQPVSPAAAAPDQAPAQAAPPSDAAQKPVKPSTDGATAWNPFGR
jgi:hypothetical protein